MEYVTRSGIVVEMQDQHKAAMMVLPLFAMLADQIAARARTEASLAVEAVVEIEETNLTPA